MSIKIVSSREFNQDVSDYQKITREQENIVELLAMPDAANFDFEPPRLDKELYRSADLS